MNPIAPKTKWSADWEVAVRVWIERRGRTVLGENLADVLAGIEHTRSISAAARQLGISYRHAWALVQEGNEAAGELLVAAAVGGQNGGGAQLTPLGKLSLDVFERLRGRVRTSAADLLEQTLLPVSQVGNTIHLAAAISLQEVVGQLLTEYTLRQPGVRVRTVYGASNELADHILAGAPCDLFISADAIHVERLAAHKRIRPKSKTLVATNSLAAIGPEDSAAVARPSDLLRVERIALADAASPLGKCSRMYLEQIGLYEKLSAKALPVDNSRAILAAIRSGRAGAGLSFASDAARASGCRVLFPIDSSEASVSYVAAVCRGEREKPSQSLLEFFQSPAAQRTFRRCGLSLPKKGSRR